MKFKCLCTFVYDGDTIAIDPNCKGFKWIRLVSIDAPELDQELGKESRNTLASLCHRREVEIDVITMDKHGRAIAQVFVSGIDASVFQVRRGMAFPYFLNQKNQTEILMANSKALEAKAGLWSLPNFITPQQFRLKKRAFPAKKLKLSNQLRNIEVEENDNQVEVKPDEQAVDLVMETNRTLFSPTMPALPKEWRIQKF